MQARKCWSTSHNLWLVKLRFAGTYHRNTFRPDIGSVTFSCPLYLRLRASLPPRYSLNTRTHTLSLLRVQLPPIHCENRPLQHC